MADIIQIRRDTAANWTSVDPILANGEMGLETDTVRIKWGNGVSVWSALAYFTGSGGGGLNMKGTATIDFGATPGTNAITTTVSDVNVTALSAITVFMESDSTATHNTIEHQIVPIKFTTGNIVAGVSFDIYAVSDWRLDGTFTVNYLII
jgi:Major tropism determinant N-terminal domain